MGLDTAAVTANKELLNDEQRKAFENAGINLCGGVFSGHGNDGTFRGKVYADLIKATTGVDLYQEWIDPETVEDMEYNIGLAIRDLQELKKFLEVCVDHQLGLVGWW